MNSYSNLTSSFETQLNIYLYICTPNSLPWSFISKAIINCYWVYKYSPAIELTLRNRGHDHAAVLVHPPQEGVEGGHGVQEV